jgi:site-specific recombinase XerD
VLGEQDVKSYLHHLLTVKHASSSQTNIIYSALKFFYSNVVYRPWELEKLMRARKPKRLPTVLSRFEIKSILNGVTNLKYRVFLMTTYSGGLRISETAHLKLIDIDSGRMQIRVEQGKGQKDRYTLLSQTLLKHLRLYWQLYRPTSFLFPSQRENKPLNPSVIQRAFIDAKKKSASRSPLLSTR